MKRIIEYNVIVIKAYFCIVLTIRLHRFVKNTNGPWITCRIVAQIFENQEKRLEIDLRQTSALMLCLIDVLCVNYDAFNPDITDPLPLQ